MAQADLIVRPVHRCAFRGDVPLISGRALASDAALPYFVDPGTRGIAPPRATQVLGLPHLPISHSDLRALAVASKLR